MKNGCYRLLLALALACGLHAQLILQNTKITNQTIGPSKQMQFVPLSNVTVLSQCGFDPIQTSGQILMDTGWANDCTPVTKPDGCTSPVEACTLWSIASITGAGGTNNAGAGWTDVLSGIRGTKITADSNSGLPWVDSPATGGNHFLFVSQPSTTIGYPTVPGGGFTYQFDACKGIPCTSSNFAALGTFSNWPTLTSGVASCQAQYGSGCPMAGILDPKFIKLNDGTNNDDINHVMLSVLESSTYTGYSQYWAFYIVTLDWTGSAPVITKVFRMTPGAESAWNTQKGSLTCPRYTKVDGAFGITYDSNGVPNGGTILWHGDLNTYGAAVSCYLRGMENTESAVYRTDIDGTTNGTNTILLSTLGQSGQKVLSSSPGNPCSTSLVCEANRYGEFPWYMPDTGKILVGQILTGGVLGTLGLSGNMTMDVWVMNSDGSSPYQITNFNTPGSPLYKLLSTCGDFGISNISVVQSAKTVTVGTATCQTLSSGYGSAIDRVLQINLNYPGNPVYN